MTDAFDPYHKWLGIPPKDQPPDHYRLLAIERFESDPQVIEFAGERQMTPLRGVHAGPQADLAQWIMAEIVAACQCLLDPRSKAEYDQALGSSSLQPPASRPPLSKSALSKAASSEPDMQEPDAPRPPEPPPRQSSVPQAVLATVVPVAEVASNTKPAVTTRAVATRAIAAQPQAQPYPHGAFVPLKSPTLQRAQKQRFDPTTLATAVAFVVVGLTVIGVLLSMLRPKAPPLYDGTTQVVATPTVTKKSLPTRPVEKKPPLVARSLYTSPTIQSNADEPPLRVETVAGKFAIARKAMALRDLGTAQQELAAAFPLCFTVKDQEECSRLEQLLALLRNFWSAVQVSWNSLKPGEKISIENELFEIIEVEPKLLTLRSANKQSTYKQADLSADLAVQLASRHLEADAPSTYLCLGAFHALDRFGDRLQAPVMWNLAENAGASTKLLLPELKKEK